MKIIEILTWPFFHIIVPEKLPSDDEADEYEDPVSAQEPALEKDGFLWFMDGSQRSRLDLTKWVTSVGRLNCMDCCLPDPHISDRHAEFIRKPDGRYYVKDISANGETYLNNTRISGAEEELLPGSEVLLGGIPGGAQGVKMIFQRRFAPMTPDWGKPMRTG